MTRTQAPCPTHGQATPESRPLDHGHGLSGSRRSPAGPELDSPRSDATTVTASRISPLKRCCHLGNSPFVFSLRHRVAGPLTSLGKTLGRGIVSVVWGRLGVPKSLIGVLFLAAVIGVLPNASASGDTLPGSPVRGRPTFGHADLRHVAIAALAAPTITGFAPTSGAVGTSVVLTGTDLSGATGVSFNGTAAASFTVNSATQVTAVVPAGASSGPITVTTPSGTASSGSGGSGAVSFVSAGVASATSGTTSLLLALPSGSQAGDLLVAWLSFADNAQSIGGMTGWTELPWSPLDDGTTWHVRCFYKIAVSGEVAPSVRWTNNTKALFETGAWRGVDAVTPIVASGAALNSTSGPTVVGPSVSNPSASAWAVGFFTYRTTTIGDKATSFSSFTPAGLTKRADANLSAAGSAAWVNAATVDSAGPVGTGLTSTRVRPRPRAGRVRLRRCCMWRLVRVAVAGLR